MLSEAKNKLLTEVGPGKPMGDLLRRYWQPIAGTSEFDKQDVRAIRLFGEDLVLYKDLNGTFGLVDRQCPHRRADLSYGYVEKTGIRCNYHGWLMNEKGACIEQPFEDTANPNNKLKDTCSIKAYPVKPLAGLLWAYMGPLPAPELPVFEPFTWKNGFVENAISYIPCNWFQCQENSCDPVHFEWMHDNWSARMKSPEAAYSAKHLKVAFDEFEYGFTYRRIREGKDETDIMWTVGRVALWPNGFYLGDHFEWRVPIDDENTLSVSWFYTRVPKEQDGYVQKSIPTWYGPIKDENGRWISSHIINQDIIAWVGQGTIADRTKEHLGASDRGIAMIRNRFFEEIEAMAAGKELKGVIRDPQVAKYVELPIADRRSLNDPMTIAEYWKHPFYSVRLKDFRWHYGQPEDVRQQFCEAMGIPFEPAARVRAAAE